MYDSCFEYNWKGVEEIGSILRLFYVFKSEKDEVDEVKYWNDWFDIAF